MQSLKLLLSKGIATVTNYDRNRLQIKSLTNWIHQFSPILKNNVTILANQTQEINRA
ncbi:hypothetical protein NIES22_68570 (plasmid) [Calothrix brevissima NIES-22]|nr:hypothetical protein NIES22_68570 [Calothrix brevissima NIES-22]